MRIKKFRIWNYKSIVDSQDCYPSPGVTILAGKNEAGKTSILEALEDFNPDRDIREKAIPIQDSESKPKITIWFETSQGDLGEIFQKIGHSFELKEGLMLVGLEKKYPRSYTLSEETSKALGLTKEKTIDVDALDKAATEHLERVSTIFNTYQVHLQSVALPTFNPSDPAQTLKAFQEFKQQVVPLLPNVPEPNSSGLNDSINALISICQNAIQGTTLVEKFVEEYKNYFPNFVLFSSFNDIFPNVVPLDQLEKNEWVKDLAIISNLDVTTIKSANERKKVDHKTDLNIKVNEEFKKFWEQDLSRLSIEWDNEKLYFWILEDGRHYEPDIRSQGKRWYLAFYVKVTARAREDYKNVILIDEPGLYLHAQAQRDVLKKLDDAATEAQVVFSTHSPYLIEADKLERIRLVQRNEEKGTQIENKIHKVADKETLTPILTAIGLEMTNSIAQIDRVNNVIVEGQSDYFYLQAFKRLTKFKEINFIFGGGAGNMPKVGTILQGWGCAVIYLYDNDQGLKDALKNIKSEWVTTTEEMLLKIPVQGAIENVFSHDDYKKYVLKDESLVISESNSEFAKSSKQDKVLKGKLFLESLESEKVQLDETSTKNISALLKNIFEKFHS